MLFSNIIQQSDPDLLKSARDNVELLKRLRLVDEGNTDDLNLNVNDFFLEKTISCILDRLSFQLLEHNGERHEQNKWNWYHAKFGRQKQKSSKQRFVQKSNWALGSCLDVFSIAKRQINSKCVNYNSRTFSTHWIQQRRFILTASKNN